MFNKIIVSVCALVVLLSSPSTIMAGTSGPGDKVLQCGGATGKPEECAQPLLPETGGDNPYINGKPRAGGGMDLAYLSDDQAYLPLVALLVAVAALAFAIFVRRITLNRR